MKMSSALSSSLYSAVLRLYPARFRAEFGDEMQSVFAAAAASLGERSSLRGLQFILRELVHLPGSVRYAKEWSSSRERGHPVISQSKQSGLEGIDIRLPDPVRKPSSMAGVLAGVALFVFLGVMYAVQSAIISKPVPEEKQILDILVLLTLILPAVGFVVGWIQGFPRWWYPYAGHMLVYSLVLSVQSLEGRGLDRLAGRDLPGWTTWLPLITAIVISLLLTRSAKPLRSLVSGLRDLSFLNFALMGGYTWYIYAILIDNPGLSELPVLIAAFTILAVCAWLVLRSTRLIHRALAIVFSFLLVNSFFVLQDLFTAFNKNEYGPSSTTGIVIWLVLSMFTLAPILVMLIVNAFKRNVMPPSGGEVGS